MNALIVLLLAGVAGGIAYATNKGRAAFHKGQTRTISFKDGSKPEHLSRLRLLFNNVVDRGNGVYEVTSDFEGSVVLPEGATVAGVGACGQRRLRGLGNTPIQGSGATAPPQVVLYAIFHKGRHVGFAFGPGAASGILKVLTGSTAQKSSQKMPSTWASAWRPVWGNDAHTTIWGRFLAPYDEALLTYLRWGGYLAATPKPLGRGTDLLALRDVY